MSQHGKDLNVTADDQIDLANRIQNFHEELQRRITSLNSVVDRIQAGWQGAASKAYDTAQNDLNTRLRSMRVDLVELEQIMRMSAHGFTNEEQDRIASFRKMDDTTQGQSAILGMA
ncbi:WXG100 family type VII secretion target [Streptomyces montanisoli]|uniref:WXG100 family type VII secretion target n=1 Tax=Streptomyces montanisoli TaxID=2798581 RepID=A0A940RZL8_9ACTN|nr:WXG100 family type VII secretion target [Streptomyces montanisoli]MBP0460388.1 WXG100 family type VII secretion target [Streptomyces montanisoli]